MLRAASLANARWITAVTLVSETNLKARSTPMVVFWGFLIAASLTSPKRLNAQAAPGPDCPGPITRAGASAASAAFCQTQTAAAASENDSCRALEAESR